MQLLRNERVFHAQTRGRANERGRFQRGLFLLCLAEGRRLSEGEEYDLFASYGADIVVQAQHLDASGLKDHRFHDRSRRFH